MPYSFQRAVLPNGLTVIAETDPAALTASAGFFVRTGARDEAPALMGVSHFLEHMMFKGTARRSSDDVNREFDEIGARSNAYTSNELTAFFAPVLPEHLPRALDILADIMRPALREDDFATEKGVILEEIAMYDDDPVWVLYERALEEHYRAHGLAHRVLGTRDSISALQAAQMRDYFTNRYSADNTVLALAGNLDFHAACKQAEALCGHWTRTHATRDAAPPPLAGAQFEIRSDKVARAYAMLLAPGPGATDPDRYAAFVAAQALGSPDNSRLHWALVEPGSAEEADASFEPHEGIGDFRILLACEPQRLDEVLAIAQQEIAGLADTITEADAQRIRAKVATGITLAGERPDGRMHRLGRQWTTLNDYTTLDEELDRVNAVTLADVRRLLHKYPWQPRTIGRMLPAT
ncbi:MAG: insulinase family protein [Phycisphaerae bacterium]|nr:insulinase family protein [Phycisphaerae bacterium]